MNIFNRAPKIQEQVEEASREANRHVGMGKVATALGAGATSLALLSACGSTASAQHKETTNTPQREQSSSAGHSSPVEIPIPSKTTRAVPKTSSPESPSASNTPTSIDMKKARLNAHIVGNLCKAVPNSVAEQTFSKLDSPVTTGENGIPMGCTNGGDYTVNKGEADTTYSLPNNINVIATIDTYTSDELKRLEMKEDPSIGGFPTYRSTLLPNKIVNGEYSAPFVRVNGNQWLSVDTVTMGFDPDKPASEQDLPFSNDVAYAAAYNFAEKVIDAKIDGSSFNGTGS